MTKHEITFTLGSHFQPQPEPDTTFNTVKPLNALTEIMFEFPSIWK